ncbi:MAG: hypothetical protein KIH64_018185, partial [Mycobacterium sp.]|nr:hypothetical protein [Mycobacterium sp.]
SYTRPTSSFEPENSGRPAGLKAGLLSASELRPASELRGPTTAAGSGPVSVSPAQAGMLGHSKGETGKAEVQVARIVVAGERQPGSPG